MAIERIREDRPPELLRLLRLAAWVPVRAVLVLVAILASFVLLMLFFRATQWMWAHWLSRPWE